MGSVGFVSRESACFCVFSSQGQLNGVQEVAGSNPVAPTFKACRDNRLRQAFLIHFLASGHALGTD